MSKKAPTRKAPPAKRPGSAPRAKVKAKAGKRKVQRKTPSAKRNPAPAPALVLQSERAGSGKVDRLRYPKGHAKAGQYAPKTAEELITVHRWTKTKGGARKELRPEGTGKVSKVQRVELGRTFTERQAAYAAIDSVKNAGEKGRLIYIRAGGKTLRVPASKAKDAAAMLYDLKLRFQNTDKPRRKGEKAPSAAPFSLELSLGPAGVLVNLDRMDRFSAELVEEFGSMREDQELAQDLGGYLSRVMDEYLGAKVDAQDIADQWADMEEEEEDEDEE